MQIHTEFREFRGIPGKIYYKNTAEFREIPRNSVYFSKNSVFRRKWKKHFRGHPNPTPSPASEMWPPEPKSGGGAYTAHSPACEGGGGDPIQTTGEKA